jgi:Aldehyde dehydrogenase family
VNLIYKRALSITELIYSITRRILLRLHHLRGTPPTLALVFRQPLRLLHRLHNILHTRQLSNMTSIKLTLPSGKEYVQPTGLFINNEFVKAKSGKSFDAINPATSKVICAVQEAGDEDVDIAVSAARTAFEGEWAELTPTQRGKLLIKLAELIEEDAETLAAVESFNGGKVVYSYYFAHASLF